MHVVASITNVSGPIGFTACLLLDTCVPRRKLEIPEQTKFLSAMPFFHIFTVYDIFW